MRVGTGASRPTPPRGSGDAGRLAPGELAGASLPPGAGGGSCRFPRDRKALGSSSDTARTSPEARATLCTVEYAMAARARPRPRLRCRREREPEPEQEPEPQRRPPPQRTARGCADGDARGTSAPGARARCGADPRLPRGFTVDGSARSARGRNRSLPSAPPPKGPAAALLSSPAARRPRPTRPAPSSSSLFQGAPSPQRSRPCPSHPSSVA